MSPFIKQGLVIKFLFLYSVKAYFKQLNIGQNCYFLVNLMLYCLLSVFPPGLV